MIEERIRRNKEGETRKREEGVKIKVRGERKKAGEKGKKRETKTERGK